ncbi:MAG: hypothetical protein ACT4PT_01025 [Methanobacteriota archaeon]
MRAKLSLWLLPLMLTGALAGCTGQFDVDQTEPIRVVIEDERDGATSGADVTRQRVRLVAEDETRNATGGAPRTSETTREQTFVLETRREVETAVVIVEVERVEVVAPNATGPEPVIVLVVVEDRDSGRRLAERRVEIAAGEDAANVELNVNVKGKDNVVVVTQAVQGTADVNVAAHTEGQAVAGGGIDTGNETSTGNETTIGDQTETGNATTTSGNETGDNTTIVYP